MGRSAKNDRNTSNDGKTRRSSAQHSARGKATSRAAVNRDDAEITRLFKGGKPAEDDKVGKMLAAWRADVDD